MPKEPVQNQDYDPARPYENYNDARCRDASGQIVPCEHPSAVYSAKDADGKVIKGQEAAGEKRS